MRTWSSLIAALAIVAPAAESADTENQQTWTEPLTGMEFVLVPEGCFRMGTDTPPEPQKLAPEQDELPQHEVCVDPFWMGRFEVTIAQWQQVMGGGSTGDGQLPVTLISREAVVRFLERLSAKSELPTGELRLPTEAEWEYACRGGDPEYGGIGSTYEHLQWLQGVAHYMRRDEPGPFPVGQKEANPWGLNDMLGNVWEMVADGYDEKAYEQHLLFNPEIKRSGGDRSVIRGGSFVSSARQTRCGERNYILDADPLPTVGFRLARDLASQPGAEVE